MENFTFNFIGKPIKGITALLLLCFTNVGLAQTTVGYTTQMANFNLFLQEKNNMPPYAGTFNNGGTEIAQYANNGSFNNTPGAAAFETFTNSGNGNSGTARTLKVGDRFTITVYVGVNPSAGGRIGISFRNTTATADFFSSTDANTVARFQIDDTGGWKMYHGGTTVHNTGATSGSDRTLSIEITSSNTFNATIDGTTYYDLTFAASGPIAQLCLYTYGDNNPNSYWKNASLTNIGHEAGTGLRFGYGLTGGSQTISGVISNGVNTNATTGTLNNKVLVGGSNAYTIFSAANSYSGSTTVNTNGRLELQNANALGTTSGTTVNSNGTLSLYSPSSTNFSNYPVTINGQGQNGANGAIRHVGGTVNWPGNITLASSSRINAEFGGSLSIGGNVSIPSGMTATFGGTQPINVTGSILNSGGIAKDGTNTLTLSSNSNSFSGGTSIFAGTVSAPAGTYFGIGTISFPSSASSATWAVANSSTSNNAVSVTSTKANIDVPAAQTLILTGILSGSGRFTKTGAGVLRLLSAGNSISGGTNIANGSLEVINNTDVGSGTINLGLDANDVAQSNHVTFGAIGNTTFANNFVIAANTGASRSISNVNPNANTFNGAFTLNGSLNSLAPWGTLTYNGVLSGAGGLYVTGGGLTVVTANNTYSGNTSVNGNLRLGASNVIPNASNLILDGGTLQTNGNSDVMNLLSVSSPATIALGSGSHQISFSNSSEEPWDGTLTITGWNGTAGQSNTAGGRIMVGVGGLSAEQLAVTTFTGHPGTPIILPSGELVPPGPSLAITAGQADHGSACVGSAATTITYTISNTGGTASGVSVNSNNTEFAVSNLSSTTIASGGTATYDVTFTPSTSGSRTAIITVSTTTPNSNAPITGNVTGMGIAPTTYYADNDLDGYGASGSTPIMACNPVAGHVTNATDCDDANGAVHPGATEICDGIDNDCNGLTDGQDPGIDLTTGSIFYADNDNDGFGGSTTILACSAPNGFVANNADCNDANNQINPNAQEICDGIDNDCDGLVDGNDPSAIGLVAFYRDADGDGYGDASNTQLSCSAPSGYVSNGTDCNDSQPSVHPGAAEIGYNLIDDDCDGFIDEGFPPKNTVITGGQCGVTLATINTQVVANLVANAQGYRWRVTNLNGPNAGQVQILDTPLRAMKLTQLVSYAYNTQYKIEVAVYYAGYLQPYNSISCTISTPEALTTLATCNQTLTSLSNTIYANIVSYAGGYRFRVTDPINPGNTQVIERPIRDFKLTQITNFAVQYNKSYNVEVSVKNTDGNWMGYGAACSVQTPVFPTSFLQDSQCDNYLVPTNSTQIYAVSYPGAIAYVFQVSGGGLPAPIEITKSLRAFTINDFAGQLMPATTYNVKVRLVFNAADPAGPFGKTCTIVTPGASRQAAVTKAFEATAYPNPFADTVNIAVETASAENINIKVYDMMGRLLDNSSVKAGSDAAPIGSRFPAGVYNVIVTQGDNTRTLRIIKR